MLDFELFGMLLAMTGFSLLSFGREIWGFGIGLASCFILIPFFADANMSYMLTLQCFFAIMNIIGLYRNLVK